MVEERSGRRQRKSWRTWIGGEGKSEGKETSIFFHDASVLHSVGGMIGMGMGGKDSGLS